VTLSPGTHSPLTVSSALGLRAYVVCATPRSGSTLLCELLKSTGVAGRPEEYFEACLDTGLPPHPGDYLAGLPRTGAGIRDDETAPPAPEYSSLIGLESYRRHLERTFRLGTSENGVFATKLMWRHLPDLQALAAQLPEYAGLELHDLLTKLLADPRYVWVTRRDKLRQAVSLWRALQTRTWRIEHPGADHSTPSLRYSFQGLEHLVRSLTTEDGAWSAYFEAHAIPAVTVVYEDDLERDPTAAVKAVLRHVGVAAPDHWRPPEPMHRQADGLSEDWVAAYHRDLAARGGRGASGD
jgi:LPS sulfotransferase NodH